MKPCRACRAEMDDDFAFCPRCGAPQERDDRDELRLVTVLFADIKGFTAMAERLAPDEVKEIVDAIFGRLTGAIERAGGAVVKYEGDCVMAAFGLERPSDLDPVHGCAAALAMQDELAAFAARLQAERGFGLAMRVGLHAGRVVVGLVGGRPDVLGDAVNTAARMEQHAPPGGILVTAELAAQLRGRFALRPLEPIAVKGKREPVPVCLVTGHADEVERTVRGRRTPTVGRDGEVALCRELLAEVGRTGRPRLLVVTGPAGLGKSRLLRTVVRDTDGFGWAFRSTGAVDHALLQAVVAREAPTRDEAGLAAVVGPGRTARVLACGLGLPYEDDEWIRAVAANGDALRDHLHRAAVALFAALADETAPTVLHLDDLHWADPSSVGMVELLLQRLERPLAILATARPVDGPWQRLLSADTELALEPLTDEAVRALCHEALGGQAPSVLVDRLVRLAQGTPLFVEEVLLSLDDPTRSTEVELPATVTSVIQARLAGLDDDARQALQAAAVQGRRFTTEALAATCPDGDPAVWTRAWCDRGLVAADGDGWAFGHETIRDVALDQLTGRRRRELHRSLLLHFEARPGRADLLPLLRQHAHAAGLVDRAARHTLALARETAGRFRTEAVLEACGALLGYLRDDPTVLSDEDAAAFIDVYAETLGPTGRGREFEAVHEVLADATSAAVGARVALARAECLATVCDDGWGGALAAAEPLVLATDDDRLRARFAACRADWLHYREEFRASAEWHGRALALYEALDDTRNVVQSLAMVGHMQTHLGDGDAALAAYERARAIADASDDPVVRAHARNTVGIAFYAAGRSDEALRCYEEALAFFRDVGYRQAVTTALSNIGLCHAGRGDRAAARAALQECHDEAMALGDVRAASFALANLGDTYLAEGDGATARDLWQRALAHYEAIDGAHGRGHGHYKLGRCCRLEGDGAGAVEHFRQGAEQFGRIGDRGGQRLCLTAWLECLAEGDDGKAAVQARLAELDE